MRVSIEENATDKFDIQITPMCAYGDSPMRLICGETLLKLGVRNYVGSFAMVSSEATLSCKRDVQCARLLEVNKRPKQIDALMLKCRQVQLPHLHAPTGHTGDIREAGYTH